jgi:ankyrin repeat protein
LYAAGPSSVVDAALAGNRDTVRALLKDGADVNTAKGDGTTALHVAAMQHDVELAKMLLAAGANVKATTRIGGYTPLLVASRDGDAAMIDALLAGGADANSATVNGTTALMFAAASGKVDAVKALVAKGAKVNAKEPVKGETALTFAAANGRTAVIRELTANGADVAVTTKVQDLGELAKEEIKMQQALRGGQQGRSGAPAADAKPEAKSAPTGSGQAADAKAPAAPAAASAQGRGAAGRGRAADPLKQVPGLERQYNYTELVGSWGGLAPIHLAARQGYTESALALVDAGANVNQPSTGDRVTPMLIAIINGHYDLAKALLDKGADPNLAQDNGVTSLYAALNCQWSDKALYPQPRAFEQQQVSYLQLMDALLQKGANVNARLTKKVWYSQYDFDQSGIDETGATPFWRAAYADDIDAMKLLVKWGADPTIPTLRTPGRPRTGDAVRETEDVSGMAPVPVGGPGVAPFLAASGAGYGEGLAANHHHYAPAGMLAAVKYMVEELHVDPTVRDHEGNNAIHNAAARGDVEMIKYLVSKGVDVKAVNREGKTTADMANGPVQRINPFPDALALLESLGAKNNHKCVSC